MSIGIGGPTGSNLAASGRTGGHLASSLQELMGNLQGMGAQNMGQGLGKNKGGASVNKLKGTGYNQVSFPTLSPEQMQLFQQLLGGSQGGLQGGLSFLSNLAGGGDDEFWSQLEAPALRQFGELQGDIASRFSGMGSGGRRSSGFQNALSGEAANLAERLQSQRMGLQQSAISQLLGLSGQLLGTPLTERALVPKQKKWWQELLGGLAPGVSQGAGQAGGIWGLSKLGLL